jgi:hypothetical protein
MPTMNRSISSGDQSLVGFMLLLVFTCIYQPLGAVAHSDALRLLANFFLPVSWVLAVIAVAILTAH